MFEIQINYSITAMLACACQKTYVACFLGLKERTWEVEASMKAFQTLWALFHSLCGMLQPLSNVLQAT